MAEMTSKSDIVLDKFRVLGFIEAYSLLALLFIAMPLKYGFDYPFAVRVVGSIHGLLFTLYVIGAMYVCSERGWGGIKFITLCVVASIPFGPFIFDSKLFPPRLNSHNSTQAETESVGSTTEL